ncbi:Crp/Fnr family transcriptional regulator [Microbacterium sp. ARD31]|uniref:Crp/Fnr family transcriptional regulator n=1 Tax=Microbacterium sp. ARD31 TaxID=2962576 RepID=UPI00288211FF|nr:Crp/Fnr family transcriptional regulator [Microbacterium sp. ARD31]MDT0182658.1 Crp/Fnr family transcriptional regulator [Microbacterium sp. ARD31]
MTGSLLGCFFDDLTVLSRSCSVRPRANGACVVLVTLAASARAVAYGARRREDAVTAGPERGAKMRILSESLPAEVVTAVRSRMVRRQWRHGDTIVFQGDPGSGIYYIESGHVGVTIGTARGESVTVTVLSDGDSFGELALLTPARVRTSSVVALTATTTLVLAERDFTELRSAHPAIDRALIDALADRVVDLSEHLTQAVFETVDRRCARRVLELAELFAQDGSDDAIIPLTQDDIAGLTGATRPTINQILGKLAAQRLIRVSRGRIEVPRIEALRAHVR